MNPLPYILAFITRHRRYNPGKIEWSNSIVHNFFRIYEWLFWKRLGDSNKDYDTMRIESEMSISVKDGITTINRTFYTWESIFVHYEYVFRNYLSKVFKKLKKIQFNFSFIKDFIDTLSPKMVFVGFNRIPATNERPIGYNFAISFGNYATINAGTASPISGSFTTSGSNRLLVTASKNGTTSTITYNSVSLTAAKRQGAHSPYTNELYYLIAPTTGSNTIALSNVSTNGGLVAACYTGALQSSQPDATAGVYSTVTTQTVTVAIVNDGCWLMGSASGYNNQCIAGSGTIRRNAQTDFTYLIDSNKALESGNRTLSVSKDSLSGTDDIAIAAASFRTFPAPSITF